MLLILFRIQIQEYFFTSLNIGLMGENICNTYNLKTVPLIGICNYHSLIAIHIWSFIQVGFGASDHVQMQSMKYLVIIIL